MSTGGRDKGQNRHRAYSLLVVENRTEQVQGLSSTGSRYAGQHRRRAFSLLVVEIPDRTGAGSVVEIPDRTGAGSVVHRR